MPVGHRIREHIDHETRATTVVYHACAFDKDEGVHDIPLLTFLKEIQDIVDSIPMECHETAMLNIDVRGDYAHVCGGVTYFRPETDEEWNERKEWLAGIKAKHEREEREQLERLKAKYTK